jgi:hypothetical protein
MVASLSDVTCRSDARNSVSENDDMFLNAQFILLKSTILLTLGMSVVRPCNH